MRSPSSLITVAKNTLMAITASAVKALREQTGAGMMDCKKALVENDGDLEKAADYLRIKGIAKAAKKADRIAAEGLVGAYVPADGRSAGLVEVNCETDFVARNEEFQGFVADLSAQVVTARAATVDALIGSEMNGTPVENVRKAKIASIGENVSIRRSHFAELTEPGVIASYIHGGGKIGVLSAIKAAADVDASGPVADLARDIAMHVAALRPSFVRESDVDTETVEKEKRVLAEQAAESGKPPEIIEKMLIGRLKKWKKEICLLDQPFVKNPDLSVAQEIDRVSKELGVELSYATFVRFERGEGIEKRESNLAEEVAAQLK